MNGMRKTLITAAALGLGLALAGTASAQTKCDPKTQKCDVPCSPGFYKKHLDFWYPIYCDNASYPVSCALLLQALTCKGADALCGRSAAASYLNGVSGCVE